MKTKVYYVKKLDETSREQNAYDCSPKNAFVSLLQWYVAEFAAQMQRERREWVWGMGGILLLIGTFIWSTFKALLLAYLVICAWRYIKRMAALNSLLSSYHLWGLPLVQQVRIVESGRLYLGRGGVRIFLPWQGDRLERENLCSEFSYVGLQSDLPIADIMSRLHMPSVTGPYGERSGQRLFAQARPVALWLTQIICVTLLYMCVVFALLMCSFASYVFVMCLSFGAMFALYVMVMVLTLSWGESPMPYDRKYNFYKRAVVIRSPWHGVWVVPYQCIRGIWQVSHKTALDLGAGISLPYYEKDLPKQFRSLRRRFPKIIWGEHLVHIIWFANMFLWPVGVVRIMHLWPKISNLFL